MSQGKCQMWESAVQGGRFGASGRIIEADLGGVFAGVGKERRVLGLPGLWSDRSAVAGAGEFDREENEHRGDHAGKGESQGEGMRSLQFEAGVFESDARQTVVQHDKVHFGIDLTPTGCGLDAGMIDRRAGWCDSPV